jgi:hypothetical protein
MSEESSGEQMLARDMAAFEAGEEASSYEEEPAAVAEEIAEVEEPSEIDGARHISKADWIKQGKDPDDYLSAEEFKRAGELKGSSNMKLAKQLSQQENMMKELLKNQQAAIDNAAAKARADALAEIEARQKEAIDYNDAETAIKLEREKMALQPKAEPEPKKQEVESEIKDFYDKNDHWYNVSPAATELLNVKLKQQEKAGKPFSEGIVAAMAVVKSKYPEFFDDDGESAPAKAEAAPAIRPRSAVETSRAPRQKTGGEKLTFASLDPSMRDVARKMAKQVGMTEQQYMEQMQ